jgi:uncharacterized protein
MKPKISLITLGVSNLEQSILFYRDGLHLPMRERKEEEDIAFFELEGTWLALYPREALADDAQVSSQGDGFRGMTLAHNEPSREEVDVVYAEAIQAGAKVVKKPQEVFWGGYSGYFTDLDGHLWEVAYNPFMNLT